MRGPQNIGFAEKAVIRPVLGCAWLCITDNVRSCSGNERWTCPSETHPSNRRIVNYRPRIMQPGVKTGPKKSFRFQKLNDILLDFFGCRRFHL